MSAGSAHVIQASIPDFHMHSGWDSRTTINSGSKINHESDDAERLMVMVAGVSSSLQLMCQDSSSRHTPAHEVCE
jgi:hypothetical protein